MSKKIAFTGPFGDINFGDYGMVVNNIYDFNAKEVILFTYNSDFSNFLAEQYLNDFNIKITEVRAEEFEREPNYPYTPYEMLKLISNTDEIKKNFEGVEKLIVNGGGYFNGLWSKPHRFGLLFKIMAPILIANELNIPIVFTGNSYGPFGNDREFFATFFSSLSNVTFAVRDKLYSQMWFNQLGIDTQLEFIPDDLLLLNERIVNKDNQLRTDKKDYVVIETYLSTEYIQNNLNKFKKFAQKLKKQHNLDLVFLPLNIKHGGMDQGKLLKMNINDIELIDISEIGYLPLEDANNIIKNAKLVISSRYHALVFALANRVPVISVIRDVMGDNRYYYNKNSGILRQVFENLSFEEKQFLQNDYVEALDYVKDNYQQIINYQKSLYTSSDFEENFQYLSEKRNNYIEKYITR